MPEVEGDPGLRSLHAHYCFTGPYDHPRGLWSDHPRGLWGRDNVTGHAMTVAGPQTRNF